MIIQNQETTKAFSQHQLLFTEAINNGNIGVCNWIEAGETIETALPELGSLTDDKEEWRAIIVRYADDECMSAFQSDSKNPFDFSGGEDLSNEIEESKVPLIRLTQMLGGVPPLELEFEPKILQEAFKAPRTIYEPVYNKEKETKHNALVDKYRYNGKLPTVVIIITLRERRYNEENIGKAWLSHKESESSEFWKRNRYPSLCRFLVCDYENKGPVQRSADDFNFWLSVMLLSTNKIDPSTLQAYRLYILSTLINKDNMTDSFQSLINRLKIAKHSIEIDIKLRLAEQISEEEILPEYNMDVPVPIKLKKTSSQYIKKRAFPMFSKGVGFDTSTWDHQKNVVESDLEHSIRSANRALDQAAERIKSNLIYTDNEVEPLNKYQAEDLTREITGLYKEVVELQGDIPSKNISANKDISIAEEKIKDFLLKRITGKSVLYSVLIVCLIIASTVIPAIIPLNGVSKETVSKIGFIVLAEIIVVIFFALLFIIIQKFRLNHKINKYNQEIRETFNKIVQNAGSYTNYMSKIASFSRGCSYLDVSNKKLKTAESNLYTKYKHIKAIDVLLAKLRNWSGAYHIPVDFFTEISDERVNVDISLSPNENPLYTFEMGKVYPVTVNNSGMTINSPFSFAEKLQIVREELYDDNDSD